MISEEPRLLTTPVWADQTPIVRNEEFPDGWQARTYQQRAWKTLKNGCRRAVLLWHRRAGKDSVALHWTVLQATHTPGVYWHVFPTAKQGRKVIWDGVTRQGRPVLEAWPRENIVGRSEADMKLKFGNGSVWQVVGSDNYNEALIGANPTGLVMSEYALQDPRAWDYLRPILAENGGWAVFAYTPRGRNHGFDLFRMAEQTEGWFAQRLTADDTQAITSESIAAERASGMPDELIEQEFGCSFEAALVGALYGKAMADALRQGRIGRVPHDPVLPVDTWWDLGMADATAIWFVQRAGNEIRLIDYLEAGGAGIDHYVKALQAKPYVYRDHIAPFDIRVRELGTGRSRFEQARSLGLTFRVLPNLPLADGINAVRTVLPRCWFDASACERGIEALRQYQNEWDDDRKCFTEHPRHDWTSHAADAFRYGALALGPRNGDGPRQIHAIEDEDRA